MADRVDRLEVAIKKLAGDMGDLRSEFRLVNKHLDALDEAFEGLGKDIQDLRRIMVASVEAMTSMMRQVGVDKAIEARLRRLESAVFGAKH